MRTLLFLLALMPLAVPAQTVFPIVSNGPPAKSYNLVVLSEGYTSAQLAQFKTHATNVVNALMGRSPFSSYPMYFNAWGIAVASTQSGSDHPNISRYVNTYFSSTYDSSDYLITIPSGSLGQGRVDTLVQSAPGCDLSILLVNDLTPGGSDGAAKTAIASTQSIADILIHEIGHVMADLGDEYTYPYPGYPDIEEPNTTRETNRALIKWRAWIDPSTPVPTPPTGEYDGMIGLFEGAHYHTTGWYRPRLNCTMQSEYTFDFCEVCREALVLAFYEKARPIRSALPATSTVLADPPTAVSFSLGVLQPFTHNLAIQWFANGYPLSGATSTSLSLPPGSLLPGSNVVSAVVWDPTDFVRNDPASLLKMTNSWTVQVPWLRLANQKWLPQNASFEFSITGATAQPFAIQSSSNLVHWSSVSTNNLVNGSYSYTNSQAAKARFFRVVSPP